MKADAGEETGETKGLDSSDSAASGKTLMEREREEPRYSAWGVISFGIIFAIFALSILATLYRDFIPGGMVGPA